MNAQRINITLPADLARDFRRAVPHGKRSEFITRAIKKKLERTRLEQAFKKSLKANYEYYKKIGKEINEDFKYADAEAIERLP